MSNTSLFVRIRPSDFDTWLAVHSENRERRREYGITDGPIYRDANDPGVALAQLNVEDLDRALQWFSTDAFKAAAAKAGLRERELWVAEQRGVVM